MPTSAGAENGPNVVSASAHPPKGDTHIMFTTYVMKIIAPRIHCDAFATSSFRRFLLKQLHKRHTPSLGKNASQRA